MRIRRHRIYVRFGFMFMFDCNLNTLQRIMFVALTCFVNVCKKKISFMFNVWDVRGFMSVFLICCYCFCSLFGYFFNVVLMLLSCFFSLLTAPATWHYLETIEKAFSQHPKLLYVLWINCAIHHLPLSHWVRLILHFQSGRHTTGHN